MAVISTWSSLPCESLAAIASHLAGPDRQALAQTCQAGYQACALSARALVLPGQQLLAAQVGPHQGHEPAPFFGSPCCSSDSAWDCACCVRDVGDTQHAACGPASSSSGDADVSMVMASEEAACSWLQRYSGVRSLTITSCDSCRAGASAAHAPVCLQAPCSPKTPTQFATANGSCCACQLPAAACCLEGRPAISLTSFLAAAGSSLPYLQHLDLSAACACLDAPAGVLETLASSCPHLSALSLPTWLLQPAVQPDHGSSSSMSLCWGAQPLGCSFDGPALKLAAAASWDPSLAAAAAFSMFEAAASPSTEPYGFDRLLLHATPQQHQQQQLGGRTFPASFPSLPGLCAGTRQQTQQQRGEQVNVLASLCNLTSLELRGAAPPAAAVRQLAQLTLLQRFRLHVTDSTPDIPAALAQLPGWPGPPDGEGDGSIDGSNIGDGSSGGAPASSSSGALLGASLAMLPGLTSLSLSGVLRAGDILRALSALPQLARVELDALPDFAVGSLASLAGLTHLTAVRVSGCRALQATARSALPLQLQALQELAVLDLDFDLHLRDMQVLCLLKRLSHLTANSFHHCIHLMPTLSLPSLRCLSIANVPRFALPPQQQEQQPQQQQQQQQHGYPAGAVYAQGGAGAGAAAALLGGGLPEAAAPAGVAALGGEAANNDAMQAAAAAVPVVPLSALPVLMHMQQQPQPGEQLPYLVLATQGGQALLLHHHQQQQNGQHLAPTQPGYGAVAAAHAAGLQQQLQQNPQHLGSGSGVSLQLLQLRQQQLYLQQQQLRLQQQQVRLQLQQMQVQLVQHSNQHHHPAAAAGGHQVHPPPPPPPLPHQQQQHAVQGGPLAAAAADPATAAAGCVVRKGWLVVLFPALEELHLTSAGDCAAALPALQGHPTLQKLVIGTRHAAGQPPQQKQQQGGVLPGLAAGCAGSDAGAQGGQCAAGLVPASSSRGVGAPWGVLKTLPCFEELEIEETATVLGSSFSGLGMAVGGQLVRLVLRGAGTLSDLPAATLLGPFSWNRLTHLEIEGAEGLTTRGLHCFAGLPAMQSLSLGHCPGISASGLGSFLLSSCSRSLRRVDLLCCAGVSPAEAQAVRDAVWAITRRRVEVCWSRHEPTTA